MTLTAHDLVCARGGRLVFANVSLRVEPGWLLAVTGPNGAGKSSLLRMLAGLLRPAAGSCGLEGDRDEVGGVHYLGHADALKPALTLRETLAFWRALHPPGVRPAPRIDEAAEKCGLGHALELPAGVLSAGQRRRAGFARLLLSPRPLWLLDEPLASLDQAGSTLLGALLASHRAAGGLVVAATHDPLPATPDAVLDLEETA